MAQSNDIKNTNAQLKSLTTKLQREDSYMTENERTFKNYKIAIDEAQSIEYPNRTELMEIYNWVTNEDTHLRSVLKQRRSRVLSQNFSIVNKNDSVVNNVTEFFSQRWFYTFLRYVMDAIFFGNSLIEINKDESGNVLPFLIDRRHVIPEKKQVKSYPYQFQGDINYNQKIYNRKLIDVNNDNDNRNLGELRGVALNALAKEEGFYSYSRYVNIFGIPIRVATTDSSDENEIYKIKKFMKDLGSSAYLVKNSATEIEFKESNGRQNTVHQDYINFLNKEISKSILGQTMTTEDGSSYSQSKVHQSESYNLTNNDIEFIENIVNGQLIQVLRNIGVLKERSNMTFKMNRPDTETLEDKIKRDEFLLRNFDIDDSYFENRYNVKIKGRKNKKDE